jgi:hypothetical protein
MPAYLQNDLDPDELRRKALMDQLAGASGEDPFQKSPAQQTPAINGGIGRPASPATRNTTMPVSEPSPLAQPAQPPAASPQGPATPASGASWRDTVGKGTYYGASTGMPEKWTDPEESGAKYAALRILTQYPPTPSGLRQGFNDPMFRQLFPNARLISEGGHDKIDFGDQASDFVKGGPPIGVIDLLMSSDPDADTSAGWWWGNEQEKGGPGGGGGGGFGGGGFPTDLDALANSDVLEQILRQIQGLQGGDNPMERDVLMQLLGGQV